MNKENYLTASVSGRYFIKLSNELRYMDSGPLDNYIQNVIKEDHDFKEIFVDMRDATFLDSTNLGLIAMLAVYNLEKSGKKMEIEIEDGDIKILLSSSGFNEIAELKTVKGKKEKEKLQPLTNNENNDLKERMLSAHQTLANLNEKNRIEFQSVIDALKK